MSTAKLKSPTLKPAKAAAARTATTARTATVAPGALSGAALLGGKASRKTTRKAATNTFGKPRLSDRLLNALGPLFEVNITDGRTQMPKMIRSCVGGKVYLIGNANGADSPPAVLIGIAELERVVKEVAKPVPSRTFGELRASLPFSGMKLRPLLAEPLANDGLPVAVLPR